MPLVEKKIWNELLDAETAPHLVSAKAFINAQNFRFGTTEDGYVGYFQNIKGNTERANTLPAGTNTCIGACPNDTDRYVIFFNHNSNGDHGIYLYDILNSTMYVVVENGDVTGGLNFSKYSLINGAGVVNGMLYFNDNNNEPRRLNLSAFMNAQGALPSGVTSAYSITFPIDASELTLIRKPCVYPPGLTKKYDATFNNNFIANNSHQFSVRYVHFDGEEAVLSTWSRSTRYNLTTENYNYVEVKLDITETIPQCVRLVQLVMKDEGTQKAFVIKQWDRNISAENTLINDQDLSYDFYNNVTGQSISDADLVRPFFSVPELAGTMAFGKNRCVLADVTKGKDTPTTTSLTLSLPDPVSLGFTSLSDKTVVEIKHRNGRAGAESYAYIGLFVYLTEVVPVGWYLINGNENLNTVNGTYGSAGSPPASVAFSGLTFKGADLTAVVLATAETGTWRWDGPFVTYTSDLIDITGFATNTYSVMLPKSLYKGGVVFYDRYLRKCGVVFDETDISIPARNYDYTSAYASIDWALSNASSATEIPSWAYYYAPVRTLNLRTRFFISAYDEAVKYATKDSNGLFVYTSTTFSTSAVAIAIDSSALIRAGLGYVFNDGDQCILIEEDDSTYELPVIGQDGKWILLKPTDIGTTTSVKFVYQIYTPHKTSEQEPFFEVGDIFAVTDPGTGSRAYSSLQGSFRGDVVVLTRNYNATSYYAEAMNPNDLYYTRWHCDAGRPNLITKLGQVRKKTAVCFSNVYIPGTQTNGLSSFEALNEEILPAEMDTIIKLILASKVQAEGSVMLAIGKNQTASIYLGEVQVFDSNNNSFLAKSSGFIGQINILQGNYGTQNHESVVEHKGIVGWADVKSYSIVRYAGNGIFPISDFGYKRAFRLFCKKFETLSTGSIEALGSRPFIFGGVSDYNEELLWTLPATEATAPKGTLSDLSTPIDYPYDIYDGKAKTIAFSIRDNKWAAPYKYEAEMFCTVGSNMFTLKAGKLYQHDVSSTYNQFYGTNTKSQVMFVAKDEQQISKICAWLGIAVEANIAPSFVHFRSESPNVQSSDLAASDFATKEGVFYAPIYRDRLSPNVSGTADEKLYKGDTVKGPWIYVMVEWDTTSQLLVKAVNINHRIAAGHALI